MIIYVFGNQDQPEDNQAIKVTKKLTGKIPNIDFVFIKPNEDLPFTDNKDIVIMDVMMGINKAMVFENADLNKIQLPPRCSAHDFDLGFQLKYLKKLGKLGKITIIGLPMVKNLQINELVRIIKKLINK